MDLIREVRELARYLLGKKSELEDLDVEDVVMAKAILDIHRRNVRKEVVGVPLHHLRQIHRLDRVRRLNGLLEEGADDDG